MSVLSWDRAWERLASAKNPITRGRTKGQFRFIVIGKSFTLTSAQEGGTTPVEFSAGGIILSIKPGVGMTGQAATQQLRDLSAIRVGLDYPGGEGAVVTGGRMMGSCLFGPDGTDQFPADPIVMAPGTVLNCGVTNLTTSTILCDLAFHCMLARG